MKRFYFILLLLSCFSSAMLAQLNGSGFYRLRSGSATDKYMSIVNDTISAQKIVGSLGSLQSDDARTAAMNRVQQFLQTDIKLVNQNSVFTDPGTVIYLEKQSGSDSNYDFLSQGVGLKYISTCVFVGTNAHAWGLKGMPATINSVGNNLYTAYVNLSLSYPPFFPIYSIDETRFLGAESGKVVMTSVGNSTSYSNAPATCHWYIEPLNLNDNYFAAAPVSSFTQNGKYYTTLRTAFSYRVPSSSGVKVYKVTGMPTDDRVLAQTEEVPQGTVVPAGLPIIIESTSLEPANNKLEPYFNSSTAPIVKSTASFSPSDLMRGTVSSASISVAGCTNSNVLYNGYGHHGHDCYTDPNHNTNSTVSYGKNLWPGWGPEGDNIGFFTNYISYYNVSTKKWTGGTTPIYKLGIKDGAVGFWDLVDPKETISGNEAYSPVQCQLFPVEKDLAGIVENGANDIIYDVTEVEDHYLYGAKVVGNTLYAKDFRKFKSPDVIKDDDVDGLSRFYDDVKNNVHYDQSDYDQSNWVALTGIDDVNDCEGTFIHVKKGKLLNRINPEMRVDEVEKIQKNTNWAPNVYCPANFMGTQTGTNGQSYFFVKPKPQEVVRIVGAIYGGEDNEDKFYITAPDGYYNTVELKGGFVIDRSLMPSSIVFVKNQAYNFNAVVKKVEPKSATFGYSPYIDGGASAEYVVYPFGETQDDYVPTGIQIVECNAKVVGVKYYNAMGVESDVPFKGVNIVVTRYDDGSQSTAKVVK